MSSSSQLVVKASAIASACMRCHKRKRKCDRKLGGCTQCLKANIPCLYDKVESSATNEKLNEQLNELRKLTYDLTQRVNWLEGLLIAAEPGLAHISTLPTGSTPTLMTPLARHSQVVPIISPAAAGENEGEGMVQAAAAQQRQLPSTSSASDNSVPSSSKTSASTSAVPFPETFTTVAPSSPPTVDVADPLPVSDVDEPEIWPDLPTARTMAQHFFQGYSHCYPVLDIDTLMAELTHAITSPERTPPESVFRVNMVFYLAGLVVEKKGQAPKGHTRIYRDRAFGAGMDSILCKEDLACVQALVLLGVSALYETSLSLKAILSIATRIAFSINLHLADAPPSSTTEVKRKTFYSLYNLDRCHSYALGKPVHIPDSIVTTPLPTIPESEDTAHVHPVAVMVHLTKARRLWGVIMHRLYVDGGVLSRVEQDEILRQLTAQIEGWKAEEPRGLVEYPFVGDNHNNHLLFQFKEACMVSAIHRPSLRIPQISRESLEILYASSNAAVDIFFSLQQRRHMNKNWSQLAIGSTACMSLLYCLCEFTSATAPPELRVSRSEVERQITRCKSILNNFGDEAWNITTKYRDILNTLANVLIPSDSTPRNFGAELPISSSSSTKLTVPSQDAEGDETLASLTQNDSPTQAVRSAWDGFDLGYDTIDLSSQQDLASSGGGEIYSSGAAAMVAGGEDWSLGLSNDMEEFLNSLYASASEMALSQ